MNYNNNDRGIVPRFTEQDYLNGIPYNPELLVQFPGQNQGPSTREDIAYRPHCNQLKVDRGQLVWEQDGLYEILTPDDFIIDWNWKTEAHSWGVCENYGMIMPLIPANTVVRGDSKGSTVVESNQFVPAPEVEQSALSFPWVGLATSLTILMVSGLCYFTFKNRKELMNHGKKGFQNLARPKRNDGNRL